MPVPTKVLAYSRVLAKLWLFHLEARAVLKIAGTSFKEERMQRNTLS